MFTEDCAHPWKAQQACTTVLKITLDFFLPWHFLSACVSDLDKDVEVCDLARKCQDRKVCAIDFQHSRAGLYVMLSRMQSTFREHLWAVFIDFKLCCITFLQNSSCRSPTAFYHILFIRGLSPSKLFAGISHYFG